MIYQYHTTVYCPVYRAVDLSENLIQILKCRIQFNIVFNSLRLLVIRISHFNYLQLHVMQLEVLQ